MATLGTAQSECNYSTANMNMNMSTASGLGMNFKKMGQLTNVGQVATLDNINKKIRQSLLSLSRKPGHGHMNKEVKDLKVAYEISQERLNKKLRASEAAWSKPYGRAKSNALRGIRRSLSNQRSNEAKQRIRSRSAFSACHNSQPTLQSNKKNYEHLMAKQMMMKHQWKR